MLLRVQQHQGEYSRLLRTQQHHFLPGAQPEQLPCVRLLLMDEQQKMLSEAVRDVLSRRNLSINAASKRLRIDRNTLTRFSEGIPMRLELVEQFARGLGEDINRWRSLAGYPRVELTPRLHFLARWGEVADLCLSLGIPPQAFTTDVPLAGGSTDSFTSHDQADAAIRQLVEGLVDDYPEHAPALRELLDRG